MLQRGRSLVYNSRWLSCWSSVLFYLFHSQVKSWYLCKTLLVLIWSHANEWFPKTLCPIRIKFSAQSFTPLELLRSTLHTTPSWKHFYYHKTWQYNLKKLTKNPNLDLCTGRLSGPSARQNCNDLFYKLPCYCYSFAYKSLAACQENVQKKSVSALKRREEKCLACFVAHCTAGGLVGILLAHTE